MRQKITTEVLTEKLNTIRKIVDTNPRSFTRVELLDFLKKNGLTVNPVLWCFFKDLFVCEKHNGVNYYSFPKDARGTTPIYQGVVKKVLNDYYKKRSDYQVSSVSVESAIKLLKSKGYKIQKPVLTYKEI